MTVFGCDASDYDWGRGPMDMAAMVRDGISFVTHKATEANNTKHVHLADVLNRAKAAGVPVLGAYHVVRTAPDVATQARYFLAYLDSAVGWWRTHPAFMLQVDLEKWSYDQVSAATGIAFVNELRRQVGPRFVVVYASKGQYADTLNGLPVPLWNANYPSSKAAPYRTLYPGDTGAGWASYSGQVPLIWQFASTAVIGTQPTCDINAYRGTLGQLMTAMGSRDDMLRDETITGTDSPGMGARTADVLLSDVWNVIMRNRTMGGATWTESPFLTLNKLLTEFKAGNEARAAGYDVALNTISTLLRSGGGSVDTIAIIAAIKQASDEAQQTAHDLLTELVDLRTQEATWATKVAGLEKRLAAAYAEPPAAA